MKKPNNTIQEFKQLLRENDIAGDPWGVAMGAWFACASHLYEIGNCPSEWQYRPGSMGNWIDKDSAWYEMFNELNEEQLIEIGQLLFRLTNILRRKGRDY